MKIGKKVNSKEVSRQIVGNTVKVQQGVIGMFQPNRDLYHLEEDMCKCKHTVKMA